MSSVGDPSFMVPTVQAWRVVASEFVRGSREARRRGENSVTELQSSLLFIF